jgi:hypothetical protein
MAHRTWTRAARPKAVNGQPRWRERSTPSTSSLWRRKSSALPSILNKMQNNFRAYFLFQKEKEIMQFKKAPCGGISISRGTSGDIVVLVRGHKHKDKTIRRTT